MHGAGDVSMATNQFRDGVVHATFQDGNGYIEGLDQDQVDAFIQKYAAVAEKADAPPKATARTPPPASAVDAGTSKARARLRKTAKPTPEAPRNDTSSPPADPPLLLGAPPTTLLLQGQSGQGRVERSASSASSFTI